jgi:hypothetical protein
MGALCNGNDNFLSKMIAAGLFSKTGIHLPDAAEGARS